MAATITEIARQAGVSVPAVSRLFKGDKTLRISKKTHDQIMAVKARLGGVKRRGAARQAMTYNIAVPANQIFEDHWAKTSLMTPPQLFNPEKYLADNKFLLNLKSYLEDHKFLLSFNFFDPKAQFAFFENLVNSASYCDGLLLLTGVVDEALARLLTDYRFPHVSPDPGAERFQVNTVCQHELDGIRQLVQHLRDLGHQRIGYLGPKAFRYPFFLNVMATKGLDDAMFLSFTPVFDFLKGQEDWYHIGHDAFAHYLRDPHPEVTAFVCHNDWTALGAAQAMTERGLVPGREISLVGYDDLEAEMPARFPSPMLTTVASNWEQVGRRCGELLLNQIIHKQTQIVHERLPVKLVVRQSSGPCQTR
jgi:LacI family transcriptional regulator